MIIKQFKSGHPIGSSIDHTGPSGLTQNGPWSNLAYKGDWSETHEEYSWSESEVSLEHVYNMYFFNHCAVFIKKIKMTLI